MFSYISTISQTQERVSNSKVTNPFLNLPWHRAIFTVGGPTTIRAAVAFHSRVRDGIGVGPLRHRHQESY
jgi:hypothetical protein